MAYYDESVLLALDNVVGKPVKVDLHTLKATWGHFAKVCAKIDLNHQVMGILCWWPLVEGWVWGFSLEMAISPNVLGLL